MKKSELQIIVDYYESILRSIHEEAVCDDDIYKHMGAINYLSDSDSNSRCIQFILDHNLPADFYSKNKPH